MNRPDVYMTEIAMYRALGGTPPKVVLDVGAFNGWDAHRWAESYPEAWVVSFEANTNMKPFSGRMMWMPTAVGAVDGTVKFWGNADTFTASLEGCSGSILRPTDRLEMEHPNLKFRQSIDVDCVRLDTFCRRWGRVVPDYLRIDVQGAESLVLDGLGVVRPKWIYLEEDESGDTGHYEGAKPLAALTEQLTGMGYKRVGQRFGNGFYKHE